MGNVNNGPCKSAWGMSVTLSFVGDFSLERNLAFSE